MFESTVSRMACDVTDKAAVQAVVQALMGKWGRVDILVNNAGITQPLKLMQIEPENYDAVTDVSLRGTLYMSQAVIPAMHNEVAWTSKPSMPVYIDKAAT